MILNIIFKYNFINVTFNITDSNINEKMFKLF